MKIAEFINTLAVSDGGPARNAYELNIALNELPGVSAQLYYIRGRYEESVAQESAAHRVDPLPMLRSWSTLRSVCSEIKKADVVIMHGYYLPWIPIIAVFSRLNGTPFVISPDGSLTHYQSQFSKGKKAVFDAVPGLIARGLATGFIAVSPIEGKELRERFKTLRVGVASIGTPMPSEMATGQLWSEPLKLLSLSRIASKKRIDLSIRAVGELISQGFPAVLNVAGTGDPSFMERLRSLVSELKLEESVHFLGEVQGQRKANLLQSSDLFLLPSDDENFGIGVAEAAAHGLPVIASAKVASARFLSGNAGTVVETPTGSSLAEAVMNFVSEHTADEAHKSARELAERVYSWAGAAQLWIEALRTLGIR